MKSVPPHNKDKAERRTALVRAAALDGGACLMGLILFIQTQSMFWLIGGVILGTAIFAGALVKYIRTGSQSAPIFGAANEKKSKNQLPAGSNVTPFRRPAPKKTPRNSNRTSA